MRVAIAKIIALGLSASLAQADPAGRSSAEVEGVYQVIKPPVYIGTGWSHSEKLYILFKNGVIREGVDGPPAKTDLSARGSPPDEWGTWKKKGDDFEVVWDDGDREVIGDGSEMVSPCKPPRPNQRLSGRFQNTISPRAYNRILFDKSGGFEMNWKPGTRGRGDADYSGTYAFDGYTMELRFNDGQIGRYGICFPGGGYDMFYLNNLRLTKDG